jgi:hypothetical protein
MKKILFLMLFCISSYAQNVGILTNNPTHTLDIDGTLRVRKINLKGTILAKDSVLVMDGKGVLKFVKSTNIIQQVPAGTFPMITNSYFLGNGSTQNPLGFTQLSAQINQALGWTASGWKPVDQISASNWLFVGNNNTTDLNFLGTTNDIAMNIRSNNTPILSFGRRQTLSLYDASSTGLYPYNQSNNSVSYIRGTNGNSAMQFESLNSTSYKPVFFTTSDGNFGFRGSAAGSDWFEVASDGASNNGSLKFTIGDDGNEPIVFRKYNKDTKSYIEMMRMQGIGLNNTVRVGVNTNGVVANSTFEVNGSISRTIAAVSANRTLTETDYTIILNTTVSSITLPAANSCKGRIYILKKVSTQSVAISSYSNRLSVNVTSLPSGVTQLQSDGSTWQQIN